MQFIDVESIAFETIYWDNARDQQIIGDQCITLIKDFITNYDTIDDNKAKAMVRG
jgi:hypothetical protein